MLTLISLIVGIVGSVAGFVGLVLDILDKVNNAFMAVIANSKLALTLLLIGIGYSVWTFLSSSLDTVIPLIVGVNIADTLNASFLSNFCDFNIIIDFSYDILSAVITYYVVFSTGLAYSMLVKIHALASRSIKV